MKNVYISELYQGLLLGLNGLIDKTIEIQKSQGNNTHEYREALSFQLELEKTKLSIMQSLSDSFDTKIKSKELVGYDNDGREVFKIKENGDARFVGEISTQDLKKSNEDEEVAVNDNAVSDLLDTLWEEVRKVVDESLKEVDEKNKHHINITLNGCETSAKQFATEIMNKIRNNKGCKL